jgi:hypothetical protein
VVVQVAARAKAAGVVRVNGDRFPKHLWPDDFEGHSDRTTLRRWRRRVGDRELRRELEEVPQGYIRRAFLEPKRTTRELIEEGRRHLYLGGKWTDDETATINAGLEGLL